MRRGASVWIVSGLIADERTASVSERQAWRGSGDVTLQPPALLFGEPAPDAVALAVPESPRQADPLDPTHAAVGEGEGRILLGGWEEDLRIDPEACRPVLPGVGRVGVPGKLPEVDVGERLVHRSPIEYPAPVAGKPWG